MIIKIGLIYSQEIGVGVLTFLLSLQTEVFGDPVKTRIKSKEHTYANRVYMYVTQSTPFPN